MHAVSSKTTTLKLFRSDSIFSIGSLDKNPNPLSNLRNVRLRRSRCYIHSENRAPEIDRDKQEQPHHINKVPIPRRGLESKMAFRREMAFLRAYPAHKQENSSDQNMETVESRCHVEGRCIYAVSKFEMRINVLIGLKAQEKHT